MIPSFKEPKLPTDIVRELVGIYAQPKCQARECLVTLKTMGLLNTPNVHDVVCRYRDTCSCITENHHYDFWDDSELIFVEAKNQWGVITKWSR